MRKRVTYAIDKAATIRLSASLRRSSPARRLLARGLFICLLAMNISFAQNTISQAKQKPLHVMNIKLYAYNQMSWEQFQCYNWLIYHESRWSYTARNGSHWGLGQMRSAWYGTLDPMKQVDVHLKYIAHRYDGKPCKALAHWERKGWH